MSVEAALVRALGQLARDFAMLNAQEDAGRDARHEGKAQAVHVAYDAPQGEPAPPPSRSSGTSPGDPAGPASRARQRGLRESEGIGE